MSLRLKVLSILVSACLLGDAVVVLLWHPSQTRIVVERERGALQQHLVTLGDAITPFLLLNQIGAIHEMLDAALERQPEWRLLALKESSGLTLYPLDVQAVPAAEHLQQLRYDIHLRNTVLGRIELVADFSQVMAAQARATWNFVTLITLGFILTALIIAGLLEIFLVRRTRQLVAAAQSLSAGDFEANLPSASSDEIGQLTHSFSDMRTAIQVKETSLIEARQTAEASNKAKSMFLATMSHEIRTPMNGILGMSQLLLMPNLSENERREYARTILNSGQSLLTLLNDILDLSKVEAGRIELIQDVFSPHQLLGEVAALFHEMASQQGLEIETEWQDAPARRYRGDPGRLRQMLSNLVSNAIKFSERGTVRISATEGQYSDGRALLEFSVADNGIGIVEDQLPQLFRPFSQLDGSSTRKYAGTGLGLSIVRSLAKLMGGDVGVESAPGQGSRFWFRIRAERVAGNRDNRHTERPGAGVPPLVAPSRQAGRVLVVEDNLSNQKVIEALLHKLGVSTILATDGQEAVDFITQGDPAGLILMDLQMPVMDGYAATEQIRRWESENQQPRHPIIALTANALEEDRQRSLASGMDDFLTKPIAFDTLKTVLGKWLAKSPGAAPAAPADTPSATAEISVDVSRIVALLAELEPLLAQNKFNALGRFQALQEALAGTPVEKEIAAVDRLLREFRFAQALESLHRIAATQGWSKSSS